jgi:hypothetical protein
MKTNFKPNAQRFPFSVRKLLGQETIGGKHGKTSVLEFLVYHLEDRNRGFVGDSRRGEVRAWRRGHYRARPSL